MNRILADAKAFGMQYLRSRTGTFFALIFPVVLILLFGAIFSGSGSTSLPIYVQDLDQSSESQAFVQALQSNSLLIYNAVPAAVNITAYIRENSINLALVIPKGFQANVSRAKYLHDPTATITVTLYGDPTQSSFGVAASAVAGVVTGYNFQVAQALPVVHMATDTVSQRGEKYIDLFLPGIIGFTCLTTPLFGMTGICAEYRVRKYFKFLATTKLSKAEWLAAKIIFYILLMLASVALIMTAGVLVFHMDGTITPVAILLIAAGTVEFTSLGMLLGIFIRDQETAAAIANAIGFPMMFLAGSFFPLDLFPSYLRAVANFLPLTYLNEGLRATMVLGNDATALVDLAVTAVFAGACFIIAARGLSWKSK
jgi:ABC-2 type transport system permease protein